MDTDFDSWYVLKKKVNMETVTPGYFPKEGEVWMSTIGKNIGFEQNGAGTNFSRPILVIKKFNNHMFWVIPLSTKQKNLDFYFNYTDSTGQAVSAILAQLKLVSIKRFIRKLYLFEDENLILVRIKLRSFI